VESAETPKSTHKTMCYNNDEIKEKKNIIQNGSEKKKKKKNSVAWNQLAAIITDLKSISN
jgi:hypothetical protein